MGKEIYKKVWPTSGVFALFFAQPKPALFVVACLFICFFFYFPVVAAFSFLKIPTRVFPMKYLQTTYIFCIHVGSSSNYCSLQIEWHVTDMCKHIILVSIDLSVGFYARSYSIQSFKTRCCCFSWIGDSNKYTVLKQPWCTKIRQCTTVVDELNRHITKNNRHPTSRSCKTRKREPTQSTLAKLMKALFEMDRILQEKDGKGKTPLFVGPGGGGGTPL